MNFKNLFYLTLILTSSCGVKSDPVHPQGTNLPSIIEEYTGVKEADIGKEKTKEASKKNKKKL